MLLWYVYHPIVPLFIQVKKERHTGLVFFFSLLLALALALALLLLLLLLLLLRLLRPLLTTAVALSYLPYTYPTSNDPFYPVILLLALYSLYQKQLVQIYKVIESINQSINQSIYPLFSISSNLIHRSRSF